MCTKIVYVLYIEKVYKYRVATLIKIIKYINYNYKTRFSTYNYKKFIVTTSAFFFHFKYIFDNF